MSITTPIKTHLKYYIYFEIYFLMQDNSFISYIYKAQDNVLCINMLVGSLVSFPNCLLGMSLSYFPKRLASHVPSVIFPNFQEAIFPYKLLEK